MKFLLKMLIDYEVLRNQLVSTIRDDDVQGSSYNLHEHVHVQIKSTYSPRRSQKLRCFDGCWLFVDIPGKCNSIQGHLSKHGSLTLMC